MITDVISVKGMVTIELYDNNGNLKTKDTVKNLVVDIGKQWIARCIGASANKMSDIAIGTANTVAATNQTGLVTENARVRLSGNPIVDGNTITYNATFPPGVGLGQITEAGIFNTSNVMLCRTVFGIRTKDPLDTMKITWTITIV